MRLKLDENLPATLAEELAARGHDRLREPGRLALARAVVALFESEDTESWHGCLVVASDHKLRVRRPEDV